MDKSDRDISQWDARLKQQLERSFHNYHKRRIDLSVARDNKQFNWTGETLIVEKVSSSTAIATVRLMFDDADELTLQENVEIESIFNRLYLSNDAQASEWLDVIAGINFKYKKKIRLTYVDRGDFTPHDYDQTDFNFDGVWQNFDISSIVPSNAKYVLLFLQHMSETDGKKFRLAAYNITNYENIFLVESSPQWKESAAQVRLKIDSTGIIQYKADVQTGPNMTLNVIGWWI